MHFPASGTESQGWTPGGKGKALGARAGSVQPQRSSRKSSEQKEGVVKAAPPVSRTAGCELTLNRLAQCPTQGVTPGIKKGFRKLRRENERE